MWGGWGWMAADFARLSSRHEPTSDGSVAGAQERLCAGGARLERTRTRQVWFGRELE